MRRRKKKLLIVTPLKLNGILFRSGEFRIDALGLTRPHGCAERNIFHLNSAEKPGRRESEQTRPDTESNTVIIARFLIICISDARVVAPEFSIAAPHRT